MNYIIDIIDTENNELLTSDEKAVASSIVLDTKGSDKKNEPFLLGKSLKFTMAGLSCTDLQYGELFTGDETRFYVRLYSYNSILETETTIWNGFILPDQYSEPYHDAPILIDFTATDGLGRLKGKYLPEDFYSEEKSIIEIISKCLELTGLQLDYRFAPAIENTLQRDYNLIYINTADFLEKEKKKDAHAILESLMKDMVSVIFQEDNVWNIEGLNIRNQRVYTTKVYNYLGVFIEEIEVTRLQKNITGIATPRVTMQPPYGVIEVTHERVNTNLSEQLSREVNDGWVLFDNSLPTRVFVTEWQGQGEGEDYYAYADGSDLGVYFPAKPTGTAESTYIGHVALRTRPYIKKGYKYEITLDFELDLYDWLTEDQIKELIDTNQWQNPFEYHINVTYTDSEGVIKEKLLFSNWNWFDLNTVNFLSIPFKSDGTSKNTFQFISNYSGLLDINIYPLIPLETPPEGLTPGTTGRGAVGVNMSRITIKELGFEEEYVAVRNLEEDYTITKEITLNYADDSTGFSKGFRLQKLNEKGTDYNEININFRRQFQKDGYHYATFLLQGANLVKDNIEDIYQNGVLIDVLDVIYNYNDSEEHVIKLNAPLIDNSSVDPNEGRHSTDEKYPFITVRVYDYNSVFENREYWEQWTDSIYKVEKIRYPEAVANIYERMFDIPIPKIDFNLKNNVKINDFINFNFVNNKQWIITNCRWNIDLGTTNVTAIEAYYAIEGGQNIPPVVEAGNNIIIDAETTEAQLTSEAFDPDGFIVSYLWEEVTNNGAILVNPNDQNINATGLTGDFYTFRVTVTDNDGATATDTVNIYRREDITLSFVQTDYIYTDNSGAFVDITSRRFFTLVVDPEIADGTILNLRGIMRITHQGFQNGRVIIRQNGSTVSVQTSTGGDPGALNVTTGTFSLSYEPGDEIIVELYCKRTEAGATIKSELVLDVANFTTGNGEVNGLPLTITNEII